MVEGACRQINAASVVDSATGHSNARREVARAGDVADVMDEEEEEAEVEVQAKAKVSLLLWFSRGQRRQCCMRRDPAVLRAVLCTFGFVSIL